MDDFFQSLRDLNPFMFFLQFFKPVCLSSWFLSHITQRLTSIPASCITSNHFAFFKQVLLEVYWPHESNLEQSMHPKVHKLTILEKSLLLTSQISRCQGLGHSHPWDDIVQLITKALVAVLGTLLLQNLRLALQMHLLLYRWGTEGDKVIWWHSPCWSKWLPGF